VAVRCVRHGCWFGGSPGDCRLGQLRQPWPGGYRRGWPALVTPLLPIAQCGLPGGRLPLPRRTSDRALPSGHLAGVVVRCADSRPTGLAAFLTSGSQSAPLYQGLNSPQAPTALVGRPATRLGSSTAAQDVYRSGGSPQEMTTHRPRGNIVPRTRSSSGQAPTLVTRSAWRPRAPVSTRVAGGRNLGTASTNLTVTAGNRLAERRGSTVSRLRPVLVSGRLRMRNYEIEGRTDGYSRFQQVAPRPQPVSVAVDRKPAGRSGRVRSGPVTELPRSRVA